MPAESAVRDGNLPGYQLIETLRWERGAGFLRGARHLARMRSSAMVLGFAWRDGAAETALSNAVADAETDMLRLRLSLDTDGTANCSAAVFQSLPPDKIWRLKIAHTTLDSRDPLLQHKTTRRKAYDNARAEYPAGSADEVLLLNEREELCEGTITSLFLDMGDEGTLLTPALACGLLAGVLRGTLLEDGVAREAVLKRSDLSAVRALYVGNSLRGLIPAQLI